MADDLKIPDDLREEYEELTVCSLRDSAQHYADRCARLIERVASLQSLNAELVGALQCLRETEESCFTSYGESECWQEHNQKTLGTKFEHIGKCAVARAALARAEREGKG